MGGLALIMTGALWVHGPQPPDRPQPRPANVLTLRAAVAEALRLSPALQPAHDAMELTALRERLEESKFGFRFAPLLQFGTLQNGIRHQQAGLTLSRRLSTGTEIMVSADWLRFGQPGSAMRDAGMTVGVAQSLLQSFGPAHRASLTAARRASAGAVRAAGSARQQLVLRTADAYFAIVRQELLVDAAAHAHRRAEQLRAASDARASVGLATQLDVMRAELLAAQSEASLAAQRESLERARDDLKVLLGRPLDAPITVDVADVPETVDAVPADLAALQASAYARRLDLHEARDRIDDAARGARIARWAALPDLQVTASYTRRGLGGDGHSVFNDWAGGWRTGIGTTYGLDRAAATAASASADVAVRAAEREAFDREQAAAAEVRAAHRAVGRTAGAIEIHRKAMAVAERQARLAALRHERGLADNVDLIDAEMNMLHARSALIGARVDHVLARLGLERASGLLNPDGYLK